MTNAADPYEIFEGLVPYIPAPYKNWTPAVARIRSLQGLFVPSIKIGSQRSPAYYSKQAVLDFGFSKWGKVHPSLIDKARAAWGLEPNSYRDRHPKAVEKAQDQDQKEGRIEERGAVMTARPATAMEIAMMIVLFALANPLKRVAYLKAKNVAGVANDWFQLGGIRIDADADVIEARLSRLYVGRLHLFVPSDCSNGHNLALLQDIEFEPLGLLVREKPRNNFKKGAR